MINEYDFVGECPIVVHNRIKRTLNTLPNRKNTKKTNQFIKCTLTSAATLLIMFIITWGINPVLAQGMTFRDTILNVFGNNTEVEQIIEVPLPTPVPDMVYSETILEETEQDTELITDYESEIQPVIMDGYEFRIEDYVAYDGAELVVGYNVRKADGSPMPTLDEYTKVHFIGFIRASNLVVGDEKVRDSTVNIQNYNDPHIYRQLFAYDLRDVEADITSETVFKLKVVIYHYGETPGDTIEHVVELPFSVNTSHEDNAEVIELEESKFNRGDFIVEILPITKALTSTQIIVRAYKEDDLNWGKEMDGYLFMHVYSLNDEFFPSSPFTEMASFGYGKNDDGSTYLESIYFMDPAYDLPEQFKITFGSGDLNVGEEVYYDPIIVTVK